MSENEQEANSIVLVEKDFRQDSELDFLVQCTRISEEYSKGNSINLWINRFQKSFRDCAFRVPCEAVLPRNRWPRRPNETLRKR